MGDHGLMSAAGEPPQGWPEGHCPRLQRTMELIGGRWTGSIVLALVAGACRFSEIRAWVPGLSDRLLCDRLHRLEAEGLIRRTDAGADGAGYVPTESARALVPVLRELAEWAERWNIAAAAGPGDTPGVKTSDPASR